MTNPAATQVLHTNNHPWCTPQLCGWLGACIYQTRISSCWSWPFSAKLKDSLDFQLPVPEIAWFMDEVKVRYYCKLSDPLTVFQVPPWVFSSFSPSPFLVTGQHHWPQQLHRWQIKTSHLPVLPLRSVSSPDDPPASALSNHISPLGYDVALTLRHDWSHSSSPLLLQRHVYLSHYLSRLNPSCKHGLPSFLIGK